MNGITQDMWMTLITTRLNTVKHGLVTFVREPYSSFQRYVESGVYPANWGSDEVGAQEARFGE